MLISEFHALYKNEGLSERVIQLFRKMIWDFYKNNKRDFPWRYNENPYHVFVSEMMLQQTSTTSVLPKYLSFIKKFPNFQALASASVEEVIQNWQGLGYNRRAVWIKNIAEEIVENYDGRLPNDRKVLQSFKGIGEATSGEIAAFAFNLPVVIVNEVNIKRVYLYFFFPQAPLGSVKDSELKPIIEDSFDEKNPREWYYALMDYSVDVLKKNFPNLHKRSASYKKQAPFKGSNRELRGMILKFMLKNKTSSAKKVSINLKKPLKNVRDNLKDLAQEGFLVKEGSTYFIK